MGKISQHRTKRCLEMTILFKTQTLHIQIRYLFGTRLDKVFSRWYIFSHKYTKYLICFFSVFYSYSKHFSLLWIHSRFPELVRIHFSKTLISLDSLCSDSFISDDSIFLVITIDIPRLFSFCQLIERRIGDKNMTIVDEWTEIPEKECE